jgi:hypothetical protein
MRFLSNLSRRERIAIVVSLGFVAATILLSIVDQMLIFKTAAMPRERYTGTIAMPTQNLGQCRRAQFDNKTGELGRPEMVECNGKTDVNLPTDRMNSMRDTFKR